MATQTHHLTTYVSDEIEVSFDKLRRPNWINPCFWYPRATLLRELLVYALDSGYVPIRHRSEEAQVDAVSEGLGVGDQKLKRFVEPTDPNSNDYRVLDEPVGPTVAEQERNDELQQAHTEYEQDQNDEYERERNDRIPNVHPVSPDAADVDHHASLDSVLQ